MLLDIQRDLQPLSFMFSSLGSISMQHTVLTAWQCVPLWQPPLREGNDCRCVWKPLVGKDKTQVADKQTNKHYVFFVLFFFIF